MTSTTKSGTKTTRGMQRKEANDLRNNCNFIHGTNQDEDTDSMNSQSNRNTITMELRHREKRRINVIDRNRSGAQIARSRLFIITQQQIEEGRKHKSAQNGRGNRKTRHLLATESKKCQDTRRNWASNLIKSNKSTLGATMEMIQLSMLILIATIIFQASMLIRPIEAQKPMPTVIVRGFLVSVPFHSVSFDLKSCTTTTKTTLRHAPVLNGE